MWSKILQEQLIKIMYTIKFHKKLTNWKGWKYLTSQNEETYRSLKYNLQFVPLKLEQPTTRK